jgi:predicted esterase
MEGPCRHGLPTLHTEIVRSLLLLAVVAGLAACSSPDGMPLRPSRPATDTPNPDDTLPDTTPGVDSGTPQGPAPDAGDAATKPPTNSSHGSGGPTGQSELKSTGGLSYIINVPATAKAEPRGLLVLLHGSTASNYREFIAMMATVATAQDLIRISVLAPNGQGWNEGNQTNGAELLHKALQQDVLTKYDIDLARVVFSGQSSGGGFLSSYFLPLHAKDYRGGAFMQCGAAPPVPTFAPDAATKAGFRLHFEITTGDPIWPASYKSAVTAYTNAGMMLTKDDTKPGGHCAFDQQAVIQAHIATILP